MSTKTKALRWSGIAFHNSQTALATVKPEHENRFVFKRFCYTLYKICDAVRKDEKRLEYVWDGFAECIVFMLKHHCFVCPMWNAHKYCKKMMIKFLFKIAFWLFWLIRWVHTWAAHVCHIFLSSLSRWPEPTKTDGISQNECLLRDVGDYRQTCRCWNCTNIDNHKQTRAHTHKKADGKCKWWTCTLQKAFLFEMKRWKYTKHKNIMQKAKQNETTNPWHNV